MSHQPPIRPADGIVAAAPPPRSSDVRVNYFDPLEPVGFVRGGSLPHWRQDGVVYFVTWRTADSMPMERVRRWMRERDEWAKGHPLPHTREERAEYDRLFPARWEAWLDESHGECLLARPDVKDLVSDVLRRFDGMQYRLHDAAVMPNHVHVLVTPLGERRLSEIEQAWKSVSAHGINRLLNRRGELWQKESFDHIVRSDREMERIRAYIRDQAGPPGC